MPVSQGKDDDTIAEHLSPWRYRSTLNWASRYAHCNRESCPSGYQGLKFRWPGHEEVFTSLSSREWLAERFGSGGVRIVPVVVISEFQENARVLDGSSILLFGTNPYVIHVGKILCDRPKEHVVSFEYLCCYPSNGDAPQFAAMSSEK